MIGTEFRRNLYNHSDLRGFWIFQFWNILRQRKNNFLDILYVKVQQSMRDCFLIILHYRKPSSMKKVKASNILTQSKSVMKPKRKQFEN